MTSPMQQRDDLSALLDGELENAELAAIEQELESDSDLRVELEELRGISDGLRSLPDATAPDGFLAAVMGRIEAGDGIEEMDTDVGRLASPVERVVEPQPDNVVRLSSWWIKGPALSAVAASVIVGIGLGIWDKGPLAPPNASELVMRAPGSSAPPSPTGLISPPTAEGDAIADVASDDEEARSGRTAERIRMTPGETDRVAVGGAGSSPAVLSAPRRSGIREASSSSPPPGIVAVAEAEYAPEPSAEREALETESARPLETAEKGLLPESDASKALGRSDGVSPPPPATRQAMTAVASLRTADSDVVVSLRDTAMSRGWELTFVSPGDAAVVLSDLLPEQVVELLLPPGDELAAQAILDGLGSFRFASSPERAEGEHSRLRVTVIYVPE